ncbi:hypothetical protein GIB67_027618 [Kingdonia uniflora]|uniref:RRM domain-containing protein n=1 Tax=Kingdonia uniflora TaxID=39325 RepID=A0A7J7NLE8_9MAGN|nr:hypothetical protein GIB67_027618 [Kingdonia uniflora]
MASSSLILQSFSPKTLILSHPITPSLTLTCSLSFQTKPISPPSPFLTHKSSELFVRNVARYEHVITRDTDEVGFSPDLKLFVGNLPFGVDSAELAGLFERAGNVELIEVIHDKQTGRSRGFAFVTMSTVEEVKAAEHQFNGYELEGRPMRVNSGPPPPKDDFSSRMNSGNSRREDFSSRKNSGFSRRDDFSSRNDSGSRRDGDFSSRGSRDEGSGDSLNRVYVGNLSWGVDDLALETLFSEQGNVTDAKVVYDRESGRSRGFGFVTYSSAKEVDVAISSLDGAELDGRSIRVTMAEAKPRRQF